MIHELSDRQALLVLLQWSTQYVFAPLPSHQASISTSLPHNASASAHHQQMVGHMSTQQLTIQWQYWSFLLACIPLVLQTIQQTISATDHWRSRPLVQLTIGAADHWCRFRNRSCSILTTHSAFISSQIMLCHGKLT
jgi:hypothetical protein